MVVGVVVLAPSQFSSTPKASSSLGGGRELFLSSSMFLGVDVLNHHNVTHHLGYSSPGQCYASCSAGGLSVVQQASSRPAISVSLLKVPEAAAYPRSLSPSER